MKVNVGCNSLTMSELAHICGGILTFVGGEFNKDMPFIISIKIIAINNANGVI